MNCGGEDFAVACMRADLRYGKNQRREDVKSHHYIISFDPRDGPDHGLTMDKAQELGERFLREQAGLRQGAGFHRRPLPAARGGLNSMKGEDHT